LHSQQRQSVHLHSVHWQHAHFFVSVMATFMVFSCGRRDAVESIFKVDTMARSTHRRSRFPGTRWLTLPWWEGP
jgi:hypothetical protein